MNDLIQQYELWLEAHRRPYKPRQRTDIFRDIGDACGPWDDHRDPVPAHDEYDLSDDFIDDSELPSLDDTVDDALQNDLTVELRESDTVVRGPKRQRDLMRPFSDDSNVSRGSQEAATDDKDIEHEPIVSTVTSSHVTRAPSYASAGRGSTRATRRARAAKTCATRTIAALYKQCPPIIARKSTSQDSLFANNTCDDTSDSQGINVSDLPAHASKRTSDRALQAHSPRLRRKVRRLRVESDDESESEEDDGEGVTVNKPKIKIPRKKRNVNSDDEVSAQAPFLYGLTDRMRHFSSN